MKCPKCNCIDLALAYRQGVVMNLCPQCRGGWLEPKMLDTLLERKERRPTELRIHRAPMPGCNVPNESFQVRLRLARR
jgi:Zn-finger nucleic acid-binding protein